MKNNIASFNHCFKPKLDLDKIDLKLYQYLLNYVFLSLKHFGLYRYGTCFYRWFSDHLYGYQTGILCCRHVSVITRIYFHVADTQCKPFVTLHHGSITQDINVGGKAYFSCNHGYKLAGDNSAICQRNKQWDKDAPKCVKSTYAIPNHDVIGKLNGLYVNLYIIHKLLCKKYT